LLLKVIIWYKYLLLFDRVFLELLGRNFNPQFLGIEVALKLSLFVHWRWCRDPFERKDDLHIKVAVWVPLKA